MRPILALLTALPVLFSPGCKGSGHEIGTPVRDSGSDDLFTTTCPSRAPCGGDVTGTWYVKRMCIESSTRPYSPTGSGCDGQASQVDLGSDFTSAYTFSADGTFHVSETGSVSQTYDQLAACFAPDAGTSVDCTELGNQLMSRLQRSLNPGELVTSASCAGKSGGDCTCTSTLVLPLVTASGTYLVTGNMVAPTITESSESPEPWGYSGAGHDYCVRGNTLTMVLTGAAGKDLILLMTR